MAASPSTRAPARRASPRSSSTRGRARAPPKSPARTGSSPGVFQRGQRLGSPAIVAIPESVQVEFGKIAIGGPETTFSKLESLGVQMGIWGASERWAAPGETYFLFPIEPTAVAPDASAGILQSEAGDGVSMEIHAPPPRSMLLREPRTDLASQELSAR